MRKVYLRLYVDVIVRMDEGVDVSDMLEGASLRLDTPLVQAGTVDVEACDIMNHEVTDSK